MLEALQRVLVKRALRWPRHQSNKSTVAIAVLDVYIIKEERLIVVVKATFPPESVEQHAWVGRLSARVLRYSLMM